MPSFKNIKDLANNPIAGVVTTALKPTPAGIAYTGANIASKAFTGKPKKAELVCAICSIRDNIKRIADCAANIAEIAVNRAFKVTT